jgi:GT2 family glycosyltransferase
MAFDYDFCVIITSYNREEKLKNLLNQISEYKDLKIFVSVFDDSSFPVYDISEFNVFKITYVKNNGKKKFWKIISDTYKLCKNINSKYYIYLQDDVVLKENFFQEAVRLYEKIEDPKKISLNTLILENQRGKPKWTNFDPEEYDEYYKTQWTELFFISERKFFEVLNYEVEPVNNKRWDSNPYLSTGVGSQISERLLKLGYNQYQVKNSLMKHGDHESVLFGEYRGEEKLIAL